MKGHVNLLNHNTAVFDSIIKTMPFNADVFGLRAKLVRFIGQFQTTSVVLKYHGLMHVCVNVCVLSESNMGRDTKIKMSG